MSFRLPKTKPGDWPWPASSLHGLEPYAGRRVPPAPGADEQAGWPEGEESGGLGGQGWPGGRLDDYEGEDGHEL